MSKKEHKGTQDEEPENLDLWYRNHTIMLKILSSHILYGITNQLNIQFTACWI
jgi:hypothetical protein